MPRPSPFSRNKKKKRTGRRPLRYYVPHEGVTATFDTAVLCAAHFCKHPLPTIWNRVATYIGVWVNTSTENLLYSMRQLVLETHERAEAAPVRIFSVGYVARHFGEISPKTRVRARLRPSARSAPRRFGTLVLLVFAVAIVVAITRDNILDVNHCVVSAI